MSSVRPKRIKSIQLAENDAAKYQEHLRDFSDYDRKKQISFRKSYIDIINEKRYNFTKKLSKSIKKEKSKKGEESILCEFIGNKKQETTEEAQMSKTFFNEIETYIRLRPHTGICKFDGYYLIPQNTIVVENFPNGSLSDIYEKLGSGKSLSQSGRFQWNNLMKAKIIFGTACSMMHLHGNKIFHENLQPSQIYFDQNWEPQLTGYASFYPDHIPEEFDDYEEDDEFKKVYPYIPPEILNHKFDSKYLKKADVFSFGVLIYTVITDGEKGLFDLLDEDDFYERYNSGDLRPEFPDDISPLLKGIIIKSWDPNPSKRPLFSQIIKALQNNKEIFPDMDIGAYEIYQETCFYNIEIPPEDKKLLSYTKAASEPSKDDTASKRKLKKPNRSISSAIIPKPKPIDELTNSELGGSSDFGEKLAKAQDGKADAIVAVGYALHKGNGCKKNDILAYQFFKKAAETDSQTGMYNCAMLMSTGCGTEKNEQKAREMMKKATGIEDIDDEDEDRTRWYSKAIITYAQMLESVDEDEEAEKYYKAAVNLKKDSDGDSYYTYAKFLEKKGKIKDALENYLMAGKKGHKMAANDYAVTLLSTNNDKPSRENIEKAIKELKKASQHNQPAAAVNYGNILYRGKYGQKKNKKEAIKLFQQAAEKDYPEGCFMYGYVLSHDDSGIDQNINDAKIYFKKAADQGHTIAMVQLARILQDEDEDAEAAGYLKRGAELKDPVALFRYGECFEKGKGVKKDKEKAMKYYKEAADKGNQQAKEKLKKSDSSDESEEED